MLIVLWFLFGLLLGAFTAYRAFVLGLQHIHRNLALFKKLVVVLFLQDPSTFFDALKEAPRSNELLRQAVEERESAEDA